MISPKAIIRGALIVLSVSGGAATQMARIDAGSFLMGDESGREDERPVRRVHLPAFEIDVYEVTSGQYDSCVKAGGCTPAHYDDGACFFWTGSGFARVTVPLHLRGPDLPVVCVTWAQAARYCAFKGKRLPTEAQWERAARADTRCIYSWGDEAVDASRCTPITEGRPASPGGRAPNRWGIYDMTGNVWEWTADYYARDHYAVMDTAPPRGPQTGQYRVIRGGGWYSTPEQLRVANRHWFDPHSAEVSIGFRCAR